MLNSKQDILDFWFEDVPPQNWFQSTPELDQATREKFLETYEKGRDGILDDWATDADGALALVILLDQFSRMMFRGESQAFETDKQALVIAKKAIHSGFDQILSPERRRFLYLPFMHAENLSDQKRSVELFEATKDEDPLGYKHALEHYETIEKFGRFPYRNAALGRDNTPEEDVFLSA